MFDFMLGDDALKEITLIVFVNRTNFPPLCVEEMQTLPNIFLARIVAQVSCKIRHYQMMVFEMEKVRT